MSKLMNITIVLILSALFMFSGLGKLFSMDQFEATLTYYGFGIISSAIAGRLIISLELFLAVLIWLPRYKKSGFKWILSLTVLFSIGLIWFRLSYPDVSDCGCHGDLVKLNPVLALLKNLGIIILVVFGIILNKQKIQKRKWERWVMIGVMLISLAVPPIKSPPDFLIEDIPILAEGQQFTENELLHSLKFNDGTDPLIEENKKYILLFATPGCKFCKLMATRIFGLKQTGQLSLPVYFVFPTDNPEAIEEFWKVTQTKAFPHASVVSFDKFLNLSGPQLPSLFLMQGDKFYAHYRYRNFSMKQIKEFQDKEIEF